MLENKTFAHFEAENRAGPSKRFRNGYSFFSFFFPPSRYFTSGAEVQMPEYSSRDNFPAVSLVNAKAAHSPWVSFHIHAQNSQFRNHKHPVLTLRSAQSSHTQAPNSWNVKMGKKLNESSSYSDFFLKLLLVSSKIVRTFVEGITTTWLMLKMSQTFGGVCGD